MKNILTFWALAFCSFLVLGQQANQTKEANANAANNSPNHNAPYQVEISSPAIDSLKRSVEAIATNTARDQEAESNQAKRDKEADYHAKLDLDAQQSMANSAFYSLIIVGISLVVGMATLCFLWRNIRQTSEALKIAKAANNASHESAKAELRAYIAIEDMKFSRPPMNIVHLLGGNTAAVINVKFILRNAGATPAYNLKYGIISEFFPNFRIAPDQAAGVQGPELKYVIGTSASGQTHNGQAEFLISQDELEKMRSVIMATLIRLSITYIDVFQRTIKQNITGAVFWGTFAHNDAIGKDAKPLDFQIIGGLPINGEIITDPQASPA